MSSKKAELFRNTLILALGKVSTQIAALLLLPLYTAFLTPADFGFYDLAITYIALLAPTLMIQMEMAAFRHLIDVRGDEGRQAQTISNVAEIVLGAIAVIVLVSLVAGQFMDTPYLPQIIVLLIVTAICGIMLQIARGVGQNKTFALASIVISLTTLAAAFVLVAQMQLGVAGVFYTGITANVVGIGYLSAVLRVWRFMKLGQSDSALKKSLISYSLPLVPNSVALWVVQASDRTIITVMIDVASNGIYAVASRFPLAIAGAFSIFNMSWTESVSLHINSKDKDRKQFLSDAFNSGIRVTASLGLLAVAGMHFVFPFLVDEQFSEVLLYIPILMIGVILSAAMSMFGAIYVAKKMTKQVAITSIVVAILNIVLTIAFIPVWGLYGVAVATTISYGAIVIVRHYNLKKYIQLTYDIKGYIILLVAFVAVTGLYYINDSKLNLLAIVLSLFVAFIVNKAESVAIFKKVKRKLM